MELAALMGGFHDIMHIWIWLVSMAIRRRAIVSTHHIYVVIETTHDPTMSVLHAKPWILAVPAGTSLTITASIQPSWQPSGAYVLRENGDTV